MQRSTTIAIVATAFSMGSWCDAQTVPLRQVWFYSDRQLETGSATPETWCSFLTKQSADAAAKSDRFEAVESGWLQYRGDTITRLMITSQSEDAYVEDTYVLAPDFTVKEVVRRGHYYSDPFVTARFQPDAKGELKMTPASRRALKSWKHTTYFFEWSFYATVSEMPFASLIQLKPHISVLKGCRTITR
jgi:hypothetical protein